MTNPQHEALVEALRNLHQAESLCRYVVLHGAMSHTEEQVWTGLREAGDAARAAIAALSATAATPSDVVVRLRTALEEIHRYVDSSDRELAELGQTRDQVLYNARTLRMECDRAALEPQGKDL